MARISFVLKLSMLLALCLLETSLKMYGVTYYVSNLGDDRNTGKSIDSPWRTLEHVNAAQFQAGDRILFQRGSVWSGELSPRGSGMEGQVIQLAAYGEGAKPIINGPGTNDSAAVLLKDQSYWEIDGIEVTNRQSAPGASALRGISVSSSPRSGLQHHIYIRNCYVHDVESAGYGTPHYVKLSGGIILDVDIQDALVENCHVDHVAIEGIRNNSPMTTSHVILRNNTIEHVYGDGIVLHGSSGGSVIERNIVHDTCLSNAANYAAVWTYASHNTLIQFNEVYNTVAGGPNDGEAFDADIDADGDIFQYNWTHDNPRGFMLFMSSAKNIIVRYNISQNDGSGIARQGGHRLFYQDQKTGSLSNKIYNNTFYTGLINTLFFQGHTLFFKNNVVYSTDTVQKISNIPLAPDSEITDNIFFAVNAFPLAELKSATPKNMQFDPQYTDPEKAEHGMVYNRKGFPLAPSGYRLKKNSPALHRVERIKGDAGMDYFGDRLKASGLIQVGATQSKK